MKKQEVKTDGKTKKFQEGKGNTTRVLLITAAILYSASLILLANLAVADSNSRSGALIKVNNQFEQTSLARLDANVKSIAGNIMAVDVSSSSFSMMNRINGLCRSYKDHQKSNTLHLNSKETKAEYAGTGVVVGILDNTGTLSSSSIDELKKVEPSSNVGFISYVSEQPNSTVIMHNLLGGESNLIHALLYMNEYSKTVEKPLVVELNIGIEELSNPLFVQVCQKFADAGVTFLGSGMSMGVASSGGQVQLAFSTFNPITGQVANKTEFWAMDEVKQQELKLMGSDGKACSISFHTEAGFDKAYISNSSDDLVMITTITADGSVSRYRVANKETAIIPRSLKNGALILEDGLAGICPYQTKGVLFEGAIANNQLVSLSKESREIQIPAKSNLDMRLASTESGRLSMSLANINTGLNIEMKDELGKTVYRNQVGLETQSLKAYIDLSNSDEGLYFLDLTSPDFHQTFALRMD